MSPAPAKVMGPLPMLMLPLSVNVPASEPMVPGLLMRMAPSTELAPPAFSMAPAPVGPLPASVTGTVAGMSKPPTDGVTSAPPLLTVSAEVLPSASLVPALRMPPPMTVAD